MLRIGIVPIGEIKIGLPYNEIIVETYEVEFNLRDLCITFMSISGDEYKIDFKDEYNLLVRRNQKDTDDDYNCKLFNAVSKYFSEKKREILQNGYISFYNHGAIIIN